MYELVLRNDGISNVLSNEIFWQGFHLFVPSIFINLWISNRVDMDNTAAYAHLACVRFSPWISLFFFRSNAMRWDGMRNWMALRTCACEKLKYERDSS
jgi:hypothetical protein